MNIHMPVTEDKRAAVPAQANFGGVTMNADLKTGPFFIDGCDTIVKLWAKRCAELGEQSAQREKLLGIWRAFSWREYWDHSRLIGLGLVSLGLRRSNVISVLSEGRKEWIYTDLGTQSVGGIVSGVYTTDSQSQLAYLINDSGSKFLFAENDEQLDKYLAIKNEVPSLEKVVVYDREGLHGFRDDKVIFIDELYELGRKFLEANPGFFEAEIAKSKPEDIAILIYTSGTTGPPKGAMLNHENIIYVVSTAQVLNPGERGDELLCYLPLCHVLERSWSVFQPIASRAIVNFAESPQTVFDNMREVSPTRFAGVPRVWEKVYSTVKIMSREAGPLDQLVYKLAVSAGIKRARYLTEGRRVPLTTYLACKLWDVLVFKNLRNMLGLDRTRYVLSGAAPISPELLLWFNAIGLYMLEGYGQTEGSGLTSINHEGAWRIGTVGPAIPGMDVRIAPDGEIQLKGAGVFPGYWKNPAKTAETMTEDGWLKTGDVGHIDKDGFVTITGRSKDIIITAGGKNITPSEIENRLKFSPYVTDAVVIGDRRSYLTCLIMIDQENVEKFAQEHRVPFSNYASLCASAPVVELIKSVVDEVNRDFARVEQIKDFRIIDVLLTAEDEELTATMKLKRSVVERKYKNLIDQMYR